MAKKVIITTPNAMSAAKADELKGQVSAFVGVAPADILILPQASVTVVDDGAPEVLGFDPE